MIEKTRPPEKLYYSFEEIAEGWKCNKKDIQYYVDEGMLRCALDLKKWHINLYGIYLSKVQSDQSTEEILSIWSKSDRDGLDVTEDIAESDVIKDLPRFLYIMPKVCFPAGMGEWGYDHTLILEDIDHKPIALLLNKNQPHSNKPSNKFLQQKVRVEFGIENEKGTWERTNIITKEEKDSFETEHFTDQNVAKHTPSPKSVNAYLRLIHELSDTLVDGGLTGKPSIDAQCIITAMELKGKQSPVGERTLTAYLKEASKLVD